MNSWDVFDTLMTRRVLSPRDVPCPRPDQLFPIAENVLQVQPEDILLSDMAEMTPEAVRALVRQVTGLSNRVLVTPDGKARGWLWRQLAANGRPNAHTGDNPEADVVQAAAVGIPARLFCGAALTVTEHELFEAGFPRLAMAMREGRLRTFSPEHRALELVQTQINFPLLYLAALALRPYLAGIRVLASSRDCWLWQHLLKDVAKAETIYWWSSRLARAFPTAEYLAYTDALMDDFTVLVDLIGSGWSLRRIAPQLRQPPAAIWMLAYCGDAMNEHYERLRDTAGEVRSLIQAASQAAEHHNVAPHAMVATYAKGKTVFWNPTEFDWQGSPEIKTSHEAFHTARLALRAYPEEQEEPEVKPELLAELMQRLPEAAWIPREDPYVQDELRRLADADSARSLG